MNPTLSPPRHYFGLWWRVLVCSALLLTAVRAAEETKRNYDLPADEAATVFREFSAISGKDILFAADVVRGVRTKAVRGEYSPMEVLTRMLAGTGLRAQQDEQTGAISVRRELPPAPVKEPKAVRPEARPIPKVVKDDPVVLSSFEVMENRARGYQATNTASATRLNTPIVELPKSIQVITRDMIDDLKTTEINDTLYYTSGVQFTSQYSGRVAVRGFENAAVKRNGLGNYGSDESITDTATIERIEIVKGPSSLLYGSSSPGGVVNYETKKPLSYRQDSVRVNAGSWDKYRVELDSGGPLIGDGQRVNYRLVAAYEKAGSFGANDTSERGLIAGTVRWHLSPNTYLLAGVDYNRSDRSNIRPGVVYPISLSTFHPDGTRTYNDVGFIITKEARQWTSVFASPRNRHNSEVWRYDLDFSHKFTDDLNVFVHYNFIDNHLLGEAYGISGNDGYAHGLAPTVSNYPAPGELLLATAFRNPRRKSHNGTVTLNYNFKRDWFESQVIAGWEFYTFALNQGDYQLKPEFWPLVNYRTGAGYEALNFANTYAGVMQGVANGQWNILSRYHRTQRYDAPYVLLHNYFLDRRLRVVAGFRRDAIKIKQAFRLGAGTTADPFALAPPTYTDADTSATTPMLGVSYSPLARQRGFAVYANYSESLVANEIVNPDGSTLPPENGEGFEAGMKFDLDNRLSGTLSWFTIEKTNLARLIPNTLPQQWEASGLQRSRGVDMDVFYAATPEWQIMANATFLDAFYVNDSDASLIGTRIGAVPRWAWAVWNKYTFSSGPLKGFNFGGGVIARGSIFVYGENYPKMTAPAYQRLDLLIGYTARLGAQEWDFSVKFNNVTDELYLDGARGFGEPRSVQTSVTLHF